MPPNPSKSDAAYLRDIDNAAADVLRYCKDMTQPQFIADDRTQRAVIYSLLIVGEATKNLSTEFRVAHAQIPWKRISGMRDRLIHGYDQVDLDAVWEVTQLHLPDLRLKLAPLLQAT